MIALCALVYVLVPAVRHSTALAPDDPPQLPKQIQLVVIAVTQSSSGYWLPSSQRHRFL